MSRKAIIKGIRSYLPPETLTNEQLAREHPDWEIDKIYQNTGVAVRHIAAPDQCASDLGVIAAQQLFETGITRPEEIDFLLFCTQGPDYFLPASACIMQDRLGLDMRCGAFDFNLGCSGFVYGLALAKSLIETDMANSILLIVGDTPSKANGKRDRSTITLFGDGASATIISNMDKGEEAMGPFVFGTDGRGAQNLIIPAGGYRNRPNVETAIEKDDGKGNFRSLEQVYMNGAEIFNFSLQTVPKAIKQLLEKSQLSFEQVDYFVFHQANLFMLEALRRKLKIPREKFILNLEACGNTSSATIPMAIEEGIKSGNIKEPCKVMIVGFGVGYSWAAGLITIDY
jgi:3-oxoacyl-[acyl-carrier-protein] synthase III